MAVPFLVLAAAFVSVLEPWLGGPGNGRLGLIANSEPAFTPFVHTDGIGRAEAGRATQRLRTREIQVNFRMASVLSTEAPVFIEPRALPVPLATLRRGSVLTVAARDDDWIRVEFNDPRWGRRVGFVHCGHIVPSEMAVRRRHRLERRQRRDQSHPQPIRGWCQRASGGHPLDK